MRMKLSTPAKETIKTSLAMVIVYGIAMQMGWDKPYWAGFTLVTINVLSAGVSLTRGIAFIGVEDKKGLVDILTAISKTITRIAMMVVKVTPIGVFAIAADAAGTMTIEEFSRLQSYIIPFIAATLLLTFWVLPGMAAY